MQRLEPFEFDEDDIEGLTRRLEALVCKPIQDEAHAESETGVRPLSCC